MAIPATPSNFFAQQGNGQVYLSWNNSVGALNYLINRSLDGVNYFPYAIVTPNSYFDTGVLPGIQYFYQVAGNIATSSSNVTQNIIWSDVIGASISGNTITKTAAAGWGNCGAVSAQAIVTGNGYVSWTVTSISTQHYIIGLTDIPFNNSYTGINYGMLVAGTNQLYIFESGTQILGPLTCATNDVLKVDVTSGVVRYYQNSSVIYTSLVVPIFPFNAAFAGYSTGTTATPSINFLLVIPQQTSPFTSPQSAVPTLSGQQSLGEIRLMAQQRADRVNSNFVTLPEWNSFIRLAQYELYDLLIDCNQMRYVAPTAQFTSNGNTYLYPLPDGMTTFVQPDGSTAISPPFYKLIGVDMGLSNGNQAWVTVTQFNFIDRNKFLYPNSASTIYGVFNCQYRLNDKFIQFIPVPSGNQPFRLWYIPRLKVPLADTDIVDGVSGWTQYIIVRAAKYALDKEESDTRELDGELQFLKDRIEAASKDRDVGQADTISDTRTAMGGFNGGWGRGPIGGF